MHREYDNAVQTIVEALIARYSPQKVFLLSRGWRLRRIHDLEALLDDAVEHDPDLESMRSVCQQVTGYYLIERYPLPGVTPPSEAEILGALQTAQELGARVRAALM